MCYTRGPGSHWLAAVICENGQLPPFVFADYFEAYKTVAQLNITNAKITWNTIQHVGQSFSWDASLNRLRVLKPGLFVFVINLEVENIATTMTIQLTRDPVSEVTAWSETAALARAGHVTFDRALYGTTYETWFISSAIRDITFTAGFWRNRWLVYRIAD